MTKAVRLATLAPLLLAAGCGSWNPLHWFGGGGPAHPPTPLTEIQATVSARAAWSANVGKAPGIALRPAAEAGRIYAASGSGAITVLNEDGGVVRRIETGKAIAGGLAAADGRVFAGTIKGEVFAVDPEGKSLWSAPVAGEVIAAPEVSHATVIARTSDGRIFGIDAADGKRRWVYQRPTPALLLRSTAGVLAVGRDVVAGYPNGKLIALDLEDGKLTWEVTVALPHGATELERIADVAGLPVIDGANICAAAYQGKVSCFEIQTRNVLWSKDLSSSRNLVVDEKNLYVIDDAGAIYALDKKNGASVWKQDKLAYRHLTSPVVFDGKVVVGDGFGYLHVLAPDNGALVGRLALDGTAVMSLVPAGSALLVQTQGGTLASVRF